MDDKTLMALTALANKLGTTAEYLWGVLVRQAPISAVTDIFTIAAMVIALFFLARFFVRRPPDEDFGLFFAWLFVGVFGVVIVIAAVSSIEMAIAGIFNPEYWALMKIMRR